MTQLTESQPKQRLTIPILTASTSLNSEVVLRSPEIIRTCMVLLVLYSICLELTLLLVR
jgi:hypothetical protein